MIDGIPVGFCECPLETEFISDMVEGMQKKRKNTMSMNFQDIHRRPWVGRTYDSVQQRASIYVNSFQRCVGNISTSSS